MLKKIIKIKKKSIFLITLISVFSLTTLTSCSLTNKNTITNSSQVQDYNSILGLSEKAKDYSLSGSIILSFQVPSNNQTSSSEEVYAPMIGYFPPSASYLPADNEVWLEINSQDKKVRLFKGNEKLNEMDIEGKININQGDYFLQKKQKDPIWYAPDNYFANRKLEIPSTEDKSRLRKGALGKFAIFPTNTFPIHSSPIWTEEVGGIRVSPADLASIYYLIQVGAPVVIK